MQATLGYNYTSYESKKRLFERLTGAVRLEDEEMENPELEETRGKLNVFEELEEEAELKVDAYQNSSEIIMKAMVSGVKPEDLDVSITRDSVTIRGERREERNISDEDYLHKELYWGVFSRMVPLPQEIDVDEAEAVEKNGMLILHLPKLDKNRQARIRVKGN